MPWPQNIKLTDGTFALDKDFKVNITGNPNSRIFIGATRFLRRLHGRTGLFLTKDLLEQCNSKNHADVELAVYNSLKKLIQA